MSGKVFANGLEIVCKVSKGKTSVVFPDPCWSPPSPPAGPMVIPYGNIAKAKDLSKGTKSVLIKKKPIARKNKSFLKTSTGNEAATKAFGQGFITKKNKGKAYFTSWSMNVMVEGYNVVRHTDMTTNNHGSAPGNSPPNLFISKDDVDAICKENFDDIEKHCEAKGKENQKAVIKETCSGQPNQDTFLKEFSYSTGERSSLAECSLFRL